MDIPLEVWDILWCFLYLNVRFYHPNICWIWSWEAVLRIRIRIRIQIHRIHVFLGLRDPDPDPLVRGMDPDPDLSIIWFLLFCGSFWLLTTVFFRNDVKVPSERNMQKNFFVKLVFCWHLESQWWKLKDPDLHSHPLVRAWFRPRIRIRIHTKMSWIRNTAEKAWIPFRI